MAKKKAPAAEEKIMTIPLRRAWTPTRRVMRTKKSVTAVREYISRHTRASDVKISAKLNDMLWASGAKKPLKSIRVKVSISEGVANARLPEEITLDEEKKKFLEGKDKKEAKPEGKKEEPEKAESASEEKDEAQEKSPEEKD